MPAAFLRKNIRLPRRAYLGYTICFATLCFDQRRNFALHPAFATWLIDFLRSHAAREFFLIHAIASCPITCIFSPKAHIRPRTPVPL